MPTVQKNALVRHSARQMFDLVDDIEAYPDFLPWCNGSRVLLRENAIVEAELSVAYAGRFSHTFATRNTCIEGESISMTLLHGPFRSLEGIWRFEPITGEASRISLDLRFEMAGTLTAMAFSPIFNQICNTLVEAFTARAKVIYGK